MKVWHKKIHYQWWCMLFLCFLQFILARETLINGYRIDMLMSPHVLGSCLLWGSSFTDFHLIVPHGYGYFPEPSNMFWLYNLQKYKRHMIHSTILVLVKLPVVTFRGSVLVSLCVCMHGCACACVSRFSLPTHTRKVHKTSYITKCSIVMYWHLQGCSYAVK